MTLVAHTSVKYQFEGLKKNKIAKHAFVNIIGTIKVFYIQNPRLPTLLRVPVSSVSVFDLTLRISVKIKLNSQTKL